MANSTGFPSTQFHKTHLDGKFNPIIVPVNNVHANKEHSTHLVANSGHTSTGSTTACNSTSPTGPLKTGPTGIMATPRGSPATIVRPQATVPGAPGRFPGPAQALLSPGNVNHGSTSTGQPGIRPAHPGQGSAGISPKTDPSDSKAGVPPGLTPVDLSGKSLGPPDQTSANKSVEKGAEQSSKDNSSVKTEVKQEVKASGNEVQPSPAASDSEDDDSIQPMGSHAMNMIMSEYDQGKKHVSAKASAAMNMIKDEYDPKKKDLKVSQVTDTNSIKSDIKNETNKDMYKTPRIVNHTGVDLLKSDPTKTLAASHAALSSHHMSLFASRLRPELSQKTKVEGHDIENILERANATLIPRQVLSTKTELPSTLQGRKDEPMDISKPPENTSMDQSASKSPVAAHTSEATEGPGEAQSEEKTTENYAERPSSNTSHSSIPTAASPHSMIKSPYAHLANGPHGLLGAYRPIIPGMALPGMALPGMALAGRPGIPMMAAHAAVPTAAGYVGMPGIPAGMAAMQHPALAAQGLRVAQPAAFMPSPMAAAPMMAAVPTAATGPYSHLGMPGSDPHLAAMAAAGMGAGGLGMASQLQAQAQMQAAAQAQMQAQAAQMQAAQMQQMQAAQLQAAQLRASGLAPAVAASPAHALIPGMHVAAQPHIAMLPPGAGTLAGYLQRPPT